MSINKRKILQSAQKHLQKGALDKALKDYQTLLEADPKDVNLRLKVGDLHLRLGKSDEAVTAYLKVADRFMKDGFDAKAVALYKQITRIDSKRVDVYVPLAELYQRLGLTSDAMGALQTAADAQYRDGNKPAALELLRKMAGLDPSNTTSRLKVAELLRQEGMKDEALAEFGAVADELERQGEVEGRASVLAKMVELDPTHTSALERLGRCMLAMRKWSQASEIAQRLVEHGSESNVEGYEILAEACPGLNREHELPELYRKLAQALRERGEEDRAREIAQRFTSGTVAASATDAVLFGGEDRDSVNAAIGGTGSFGAETFEDSGFVTDGGLRAPSRERDGIDGRLRATAATPFAPPPLPPVTPVETAGPEPAAAADASDSDATPAPDPDQLLAEATVYVRYGKHERAIESLRALLGRDPDHRKALEKLAEAAAATGQVESAVEAWQRAAEVARAEGDDSGFAALRERLEALDPAAAAALDEAPAEDATDATDTGDAEEIELSLDRELPPAEDDGLEIEIDELDVSDVGDALAGGGDGLSLELGPAVGADASEGDLSFGEPLQGPPERRLELDEASDASDAAPSAEPDAAGSAEGELEFEIDVDLSDGAPADGSDAVAGSDTSDGALAADASEDLELSDDASGPDLSDDEASAHDAGAADEALAETSAPASTSARAAAIGEELETAAFFLAQGMLDEAEDLCRKILDSAPNHPQALLRLGEVEAARAAELAAADAPDAEASEAELTDATADDDTTGEIATPVAPPPPSAAAPTEAPAAPSLPEAEPPVSAEAAPAAACATAPAPAPAPLEADATEPVAEHADGSVDLDLSEEEAEEAPAAIDEAPAAVAAATEEGDFDLAAELSDVGSDASPMSALGAEGTEEEGFRQVFAAFKAGVEKQLGAQDYEARYDLGIAYREMGLLDDAVGEFRTALDGPSHKLQCLHMLGLCALDLGRTADAVAHLEQALAWPELPAEQQTALRFDLGRAFEAAGDRARARAAWEAVVAADPGFADAAERLAGLDAPDDDASGDEGETAEAFESFDDLLEEDAAAAAGARPEPAHESFESFDDLMESDEEDAEASRDERGADETAVAEITASDAALAEEEPFEADPTDEPDPEPAPPPAREEREPPKGGKGGRRKKISFV